MNPIKPDPDNSPDAAARKVENLARAKEPSNEQESWLRTVLQNASDMITVIGPDRTIRYVSSAVERILGYRPEQLIGTSAFDYVHPDDVENLADSFAEALDKPGVLPPIEFRLRTADGSWRHVEVIRNNQLDDPAVKGIVTTTRDVTDRKRSEERLRAQYKGFPIPTFTWQRVQDDFELVDFNQAADIITLGGLRSWLGVRASEWYSDRPQVLGMLRRCFSEGTIIQDEIPWRMVTTGEDKHFAITFAYVPPDLVILHAEDITERKRAEEEVRFQAKLLDTVGQAIIATDPQGKVLYWNRAAEELYGWSKDEVIGLSIMEVTPSEEMVDRAAEIMAEILAGRSWSGEFEVRRKDGTTFPAMVTDTPIYDERGDLVGIIGISTDITEIKQTEELRRSEERFRLLVEGVKDYAIFMLDPEGCISSWNSGAQRINGYDSEEIIGRHFSLFYLPEDVRRGHPEEELRLAKEHGRYEEEGMRVRKDGSRFWASVLITALSDEEGNLRGFSKVVRDITERKEAEEERARRARYATLRAEVSTFLAEGGSLQSILQRCTERMVDHLDAAFARIWTLNEEENMLELEASAGMYTHLDGPHSRVPVGSFKIGHIAQERLPHLTNDVLDDPRVSDKEWAKREGIVAFAGYPLMVERRVVGVMAMFSRQPLQEDTIEALESVADAVAQGIQRKRAMEALRESEERFRLLAENAGDLIARYRLKPTPAFEYVSPSATTITGYTPEEYYADPELGYKIVYPEDRQLLDETLHHPEAPSTIRWIRKDGKVIWTEQRNKPIFDEAGELVAIEGISRDVTERRRADEALRSSEEFFRALYENAEHPIFLLDRDLNFVDVNPYACEFYGYSREEFRRMKVSDITVPEERDDQRSHLERIHKQGRVFVRERRHRKKNGEIVTVTADAARVTRSGQELYVSKITDITERKRAEEQLQYRAFHDLLTGLPNRYLLLDRLGQALKRTKRTKDRKVAILFMDLDNFKGINDSLGHEVGDQLLIAVTRRLGGCLRPEDTLVRFGGDEFAILLEHVGGPEDAVRVVERITRELRAPFVVDRRELFVRISIGVAVGEAPTKSAEDLIRDADTAMYRAKEEGSDYRIFDPEMYVQALNRLELEHDMRRAVEAEEFVVHYQPIVDLRSGGVSRVEALVRWNHPERGLLNPSEFLAVVEESGLIIPMGEQVLEEACRQAKEWQEEHPGIAPLVMSVNLSATQLRRPGLATTAREVLRSTGLQAECLSLDITETVYIKVLEGNTGVLGELKKLGVKISIDDFGVGYSSLAYLKRLPADVLKIDKSFVKGLGEDVEDTAIVGMVIELARTLGMAVIAEGVESEGQAALLEEMGCDMAQGYYFAEPLPPGEASEFLSEERLAVQDEQSGCDRGNESALPDEPER